MLINKYIQGKVKFTSIFQKSFYTFLRKCYMKHDVGYDETQAISFFSKFQHLFHPLTPTSFFYSAPVILISSFAPQYSKDSHSQEIFH